MRSIINQIRLVGQKEVLIIGDLMLDEYLFGDVSRISPEAPVPILKEKKCDWSLGGAANVALNCKRVGCKVDLIGVIGDSDFAGNKLFSMLAQNGISTRGLIKSSQRITTCKKRAMANSQQLLRIDVEDEKPLTKEEFSDVVNKLDELIKPEMVILASDYLKGVLTPEVFEYIIKLARERGCLVLADPKGKNFEKYKNVNYLKPNYKEFCQILEYFHLPLSDSIIENGKKICSHLNIDGLFITLGEKGIQFVSAHGDIFSPACKQEVFDLTGAGDTVFAFLALSFSAKLEMKECLRLANHAAAVAVSHLKTYAVGLDELIDKGAELQDKIFYDWALLKIELDWLRLENKKIIFTNGCFDLLHSGHVYILEEAKKMGDILVVAINSDESVKRYKGQDRPIRNLFERMQVMAALRVVDFVVVFDQDTPKEIIEYLKPDVLVKGGDYQKEKIAGYQFMMENGGTVQIVDYKQGYSTTNMIEKIKKITCE